jgi:hypothetical protein
MEAETLHARIEHRIAELRAAFASIEACRASLEHWQENGEPRHALQLELRRPQQQTLVSGPARTSAEAAVQAAFELAEAKLRADHA